MHAACFPAEPWDEASFATLLTQPGLTGLIDERGGFLLLRTILDEAEIITIGAATPRQGIASALLTAALTQAAATRVRKIHLEVAATNAPARALYEKFGFVQTGLRKRYYADGGDALVLQKAVLF
jgi:ribosomal-protein-alanine N-acetyltransferase